MKYPKSLSRRGFLKLSGTASLSLVLSACGLAQMPTTTPTSTNTPPPTTTLTLTATLTPTSTPVPTNTPTVTPSPNPTVTNTPEPTETPAPEKTIFEDSFESGNFRIGSKGWARDGWNEHVNSKGGTISIEDVQSVLSNSRDWVDSNGNPRGKVMVTTIQGDAVPIPSFGPGKWRALYPGWVNGWPETMDNPTHSLNSPAGVQVDVWVTPDIGGVSLLSVHSKSSKPGHNDSVIAFAVHEGDRLDFTVRNGDGGQTVINILPGLWKRGEWNTLKFVVRTIDGVKRVYPYVNGYLGISDPSKAPIYPDYVQEAFFDAHGGVNRVTPDGNDGLLQGGMVINDNFRVFQIIQ